MKAKELLLNNNIDYSNHISRIGGSALLPKNINWPKNPDGEKLTLIASISVEFLKKYLDVDISKEYIVSVFSTYNKDDYFLDLITYHGDEEEYQNICDGYTRVIIHEKGEPRNESNVIIPAKEIFVGITIDDYNENYHGSKIGGQPSMLQNENLNLDGNKFIIQFYGGDFPEGFDDIFDLSDAIGYLFLSKTKGMFFIQTT